MNSKDKHEGSTLTIVEAVETLSRIADMNLEHGVGFVKESERSTEPTPMSLTYRTVELIPSGDPENTVKEVRETFRVILNYLHNFYEKEYHYVADPEINEGIKTIMVLVGEAAKKLDKYTTLFHHHKAVSVTELKEYKRLQEFYLTRISHKVDEGMLGKWILALTNRMTPPPQKPSKVTLKPKSLTKHVFVDLDGVKKDSEYELFFIRKEDGTRFFNPRVIRNIKLVCDFGDYFTERKKEDDPLESLNAWQDHFAHVLAKQILHPISELATAFYHCNIKTQTSELGDCLSKALVALMLSSDAHNLLHDLSLKCSIDYLKDFEHFMRQALHTREYQKLIAYPPKKSDVESTCLLELSQALCKALFVYTQGDVNLVNRIAELVKEAAREVSPEHAHASGNLIWNRLASNHAALVKMMKRHPNGPLFKVLDLLENGSYNAFDPISQNNLPHQMYSLYVDNRRIINVHLPSPIYQEFIQKATVIEEFKAFLRALDPSIGEKHLLFNLQDRTSWREHARSIALEDLQKLSDFSNRLTVVTLPKDTEFYYQLPPYQEENHAEVFMKRFKEQIKNEESGFYFPPQIKEALFPEFVDEVIHTVHRVFFSGKNVLLREHRINFIELVYQFLELKIIELVHPSSMSFTCKDGVDIGSTASAELFLFLKLLSEEGLSERDFDLLNYVLYGSSISVRQRVILPERFQRLLNVVKTLELANEEFGSANYGRLIREAFGLLFKSPMLNGKVG
jgi:hypothetical protein